MTWDCKAGKYVSSLSGYERNYKVTNGVLLRGDIHTLFDLNLIGIDQGGVVHISEELDSSEYGIYSGELIAESIPQEIKTT